MPNWIRNKVMVGSKSKLIELRKEYCTLDEKTKVEYFDFEKVVEMPKELKIEFSSKSDDGLSLYLTKISPEVDYFGDNEDKISKIDFINLKVKLSNHVTLIRDCILSKEEIKELKEKYKKEFDDVLMLGKKQINNLKMFNSINWYEWSIEHWGSKWNSINLQINEEEKYLTFDTAWNAAIPVMKEISKKHPNLKFALLYGDEVISVGTGYVLFGHGDIVFKGTFDDYSIDAFKLAMDIYDCHDLYQYNEVNDTYIRKH